MIICPFCGRESASDVRCTKCHARLDREARSLAYSTENDPRSDRVGPISTKTARIICWIVLGLLLVAFVVLTELSGNGFSNGGK